MPYAFEVHQLEVGTEIDHVDVTLAGFDEVNIVDLEKTAGNYSLELPTDDIRLEDPVVSEGGEDPEAFMRRRAANLTGTLVNDGDPAQMAYVVYALYNKDGEIILSGKDLESELASGEMKDYYHEIGPAIYELPAYDHADFYFYKRAQDE